MGREEQPKQDNRAVEERKQLDNRAVEEKRPADAKQQGQREPGRDRNNQAAEPTATPGTQQGARSGDTVRDRERGQNTAPAAEQSARRGATSRVTVNDEQRKQIVERLRQARVASNENINVRVNVGEQLPPRVHLRPLPPDIVQVAPQYRDHEYTVVDDRIAIVDPRTYEVVDYIDEPGSVAETTSHFVRDFVITPDEREILRQAARSMTVGSSSPSRSVSSCLMLQPVPEELVRTHPELGRYRYLAIGDQVVLVDPDKQKIVQLID
ncbi:MAG TPA: DUF1236 domain-containing protein [Bradyrhizobium sp.]